MFQFSYEAHSNPHRPFYSTPSELIALFWVQGLCLCLTRVYLGLVDCRSPLEWFLEHLISTDTPRRFVKVELVLESMILGMYIMKDDGRGDGKQALL